MFALKSRHKALLGAGGWGGVQRSRMPVRGYPGRSVEKEEAKRRCSASASPDARAPQPAVLSSLHRHPPPRLSTRGCVTWLLVVVSSKNELPSGKAPLGDIGWSPVSEVHGPATAKSSPSLPRTSLQFGCPIATSVPLGHGWKAVAAGLTGSTASGMEGLGVAHCLGKSWPMEIGTDWGTQGRGLEEEEPREGVSPYRCPQGCSSLVLN